MSEDPAMNDKPKPPRLNRGSLQELIGGLSDGIILLDQAGAIIWANNAAIVMHRANAIDDLGEDIAGYRRRFTLR